jgi:hypothetical protein
MKSIGEWLILPFIFFIAKARLLKEEIKLRKRYDCNSQFRFIDKELRRAYFGLSPYVISKKFLKQKGEENVHVYGETPLTTLGMIATRCAISQDDYVVELGCGRGRGVFFLSCHFGCTVEGIEWISEFVDKAQEVAKKAKSRLNCTLDITFSCQDMLKADLSNASVIYLYGTCLEDSSIARLLTSFRTLKKGAKVITVSYPITDYPNSDCFILKDSFIADYIWGKAEVFLHEKII